MQWFFDKNDIYLNKIQSTVKIFVARFNVPVKFEFVWSWRGLNQQIDKSRFAAQAVARSDGGGARKETLLARHLVFSRRFRPRSAQKYSQRCAGNGPIATRAGSWGRHFWHQVQLFRFFVILYGTEGMLRKWLASKIPCLVRWRSFFFDACNLRFMPSVWILSYRVNLSVSDWCVYCTSCNW